MAVMAVVGMLMFLEADLRSGYTRARVEYGDAGVDVV